MPKSNPSSFTFIWTVLKLSIKYQSLCLLDMIITFIVFPTLILAHPLTGMNQDWSGTLVVLVYNCSDTLAKICTHVFHHPATSKTIHFLVFARIIFLPLFILTYFYYYKAEFSSPYFSFITIALFSFSHGFVITEIFVLTRYSC